MHISIYIQTWFVCVHVFFLITMMSSVSYSLICHEDILEFIDPPPLKKSPCSIHPISSHITPFNHPNIIFGKILVPFKRGISISPIGYPLLRTYPHPKEPGFPIPSASRRLGGVPKRIASVAICWNASVNSVAERSTEKPTMRRSSLGTRFSLKKKRQEGFGKCNCNKKMALDEFWNYKRYILWLVTY